MTDQTKTTAGAGVDYALTDYERASDAIIKHAENRIGFGVSALAVHGSIARLDTPFIE